MDDFTKRIEALSAEKRELLEVFLKEKKIDTNWLQETYIAPRNSVEQALAEIWTQVLGVVRVGIHDNFFELGGDSILSIQIIAKAGEMDLQIHRNQLFEHPTIAELAPLVGASGPPQDDAEEAAGAVPLAPAQRSLLAEPEAMRCTRMVLLEARNADAALLERAVRCLLERHGALRLRFEAAGGEWRQLAAAPADGFFARLDLSHLPEAEQVKAARETAERLCSGWDLSCAPLLRLNLLGRGGGRPDWLLFAVHPLVCDAESFRILLQELQAAYEQLARGGEVRLAAGSTPFQSWCRRLARHAESSELARELDWWLAQAEPPAPNLPLDVPDGGDGGEAVRSVVVSLSEDDTQALLQEIPAAYRTQVTDLLLTALAQTVAAWTAGTAVRFDLEGSARTTSVLGADLSRTVGACSFLYPVQLSLEGAGTPSAALRAVKEQLRRVPEHGLGYSLLAAGAGSAERVRALPRAPILVAYRPQLAAADDSSVWRLADEPLAPGGEEHRSHVLVVTAGVAGNCAHVSFEYREDLLRRATVEGLAARFATALRVLIAECGAGAAALTPSDFPDAELSQEDLDRLFAS